MKELSKESVMRPAVDEDSAGQRIDNYLIRHLKGVPKSHVYRILRSGEVRVNSRRVGPDYRLVAGDRLRLPPLRLAASTAPSGRFEPEILFEDDSMLVINKPAGMAVHGGSGISLGVIEGLRNTRGEERFLELVHRLDRDTSGVLMLAKKRSVLVALHRQLQDGGVGKFYLCLVKGRWQERKRLVDLPLQKRVTAVGERRVSVDREGSHAVTVFRLQRLIGPYSLLEAELKTGRTHQIRVHLAHLGFPLIGDDKYGDFALNKSLVKAGLKRMFLHAARATIRHPVSGDRLTFTAELPEVLRTFIENTKAQKDHAAPV